MLVLGLVVAAEIVLLPLGIDDLDEGYFAELASRVVRGQMPYRDFEALYTPGLLYLHAMAFAALDEPSLLAMRVLGVCFRAGLVLMLLVMTLPLVPHRPLLAALPGLVVLLAFDAAPDRWEPHPGWPSTLFAVVTAYCIARQPTPAWLVAAGVAAGLTYLFKQNTGVYMLGAVLIWGVASRTPRRVLLPAVGFIAVTLLWLVPLVVAIDGRLLLLAGFVGAVNQAGLFSPPELSIVVPLACLVGGVWLVRKPDADWRVRWYLLSGVCLFLTQYPRFDTLHLAWSAPLLLVVGAAALDRVAPAIVALALAGLVALAAPLVAYRSTLLFQPTVVVDGLPGANGLRIPEATRDGLVGVVDEIHRRTRPGEPIFVYPSSPLVYVLADRPNASRFAHVYPGAADPAQLSQLVDDLEDVQLVVMSDFWRQAYGDPGSNAPLEQWLGARFQEVARFGSYRVYNRA